MAKSFNSNPITAFVRERCDASGKSDLQASHPYRWVVYWVQVLVLAGLGLWLGRYLDDQDAWIHTRYQLYGAQTHSLDGPEEADTNSRYVVIDDDTFYGPQFARKRPLNRAQLAAVIDAVSANNPEAIVMDLEIREPMPGRGVQTYDDETAPTNVLVTALRNAGQKADLIIAIPLERSKTDEGFERQATVYDLIPKPGLNLRLFPAFTLLNYDPRSIPTCVTAGGENLESISLAVLHATAEERIYAKLAKPKPGSPCTPDAEFHTKFGRFMPKQQFESHAISAEKLLQTNLPATELAEIRHQLEHKIVFVCGAWHDLGFATGRQVDLHDSPSGMVPGAFLQANYFEALRNGNYVGGLSLRAGEVMEVLSVLISALLLQLFARSRSRWLALLLPILVMLFVSFFGLQTLGAFFDCTIPVVVLLCHLALDKILDWFYLAKRYEKLKKEGQPGKPLAIEANTSTNS